MMRFRSLVTLGSIAHVPGEIGGKLRGRCGGLGAIQDVHFVGENRGDSSELATGSAFLSVDGGELRTGGVIDPRWQAADVNGGLADVGALRITPGIVVFSRRRRAGKRPGIGGLGGGIRIVRHERRNGT